MGFFPFTTRLTSPERVKGGLNPVSKEFKEDCVGRQWPVLAHFLCKLVGFSRQGFHSFGQLGLLGTLNLYLFLHPRGLLGCSALLGCGHLELPGELLLLCQHHLVALGKQGQLLLQSGGLVGLLFSFRLHGRELFL